MDSAHGIQRCERNESDVGRRLPWGCERNESDVPRRLPSGGGRGGTFTDLILYAEDASRIYVHKLPSTPADPAVAIAQGVREVCALAGTQPSGLSELLHGTTVGTNTILERKGARVGMVATGGFRDILHIARHRKPYNFSSMQDVPQQSRPPLLRARGWGGFGWEVLRPGAFGELAPGPRPAPSGSALFASRSPGAILTPRARWPHGPLPLCYGGKRSRTSRS
ncbi:MAG: hydantoinase/oxoprolinase N-terminal domain-containing protein, partial [Solirubrobacteraceae bacterium]